jgi:hypothetical protein
MKTAAGVPLLPPDWYCAANWNIEGTYRHAYRMMLACQNKGRRVVAGRKGPRHNLVLYHWPHLDTLRCLYEPCRL